MSSYACLLLQAALQQLRSGAHCLHSLFSESLLHLYAFIVSGSGGIGRQDTVEMDNIDYKD